MAASPRALAVATGFVDIRTPAWEFAKVVPAADGGFYAAAWIKRNPLPLSIVKLTHDGLVGPSFTNGTFPDVVGALDADMLVRSDGKILISSNTQDIKTYAERTDPIIVRFNTNGTRD